MNFINVMLNNNVTLESIIGNNANIFFELPYKYTSQVIPLSKQIEFCKSTDYCSSRYKMMVDLLSYTGDDVNKVDPLFFIEFVLTHYSSMNNLTDIINFIDSHAQAKSMIMYLINHYETHQNIVSNIVDSFATQFNLFIKYYDTDILNTSFLNGFPFMGDDNMRFITQEHPQAEENLKVLKTRSLKYIKATIDKHLGSDDSWKIYSIPNCMSNLLSESEIMEVFAMYKKEHSDTFESLFNQFANNENLSEETALEIATKYDLRVPYKFKKSDKVMQGVVESQNIKPNFSDPFTHIINNEMQYFKGEVLEQLINNACKIENIINSHRNLNLITSQYNERFMSLPNEFFIDLFDNHFEYITQAFPSFVHQDNMFRIVQKYLSSTHDKAAAYEKVSKLLNFNGMAKVFSSENVITPEYLDLIFKNNKALGLKVSKELLTNNHDLMEKILA